MKAGNYESFSELFTATRKNAVSVEQFKDLKGLTSDGTDFKAILIATGSEVEIAVAAQKMLASDGIPVRVVSMPSMELYDEQSDEYKESVLPKRCKARVSVEAGVSMPWYKYVGTDGAVIGIDHFGASAPAETLYREFGFTAENVADKVKQII